jgi:hypothetical protein
MDNKKLHPNSHYKYFRLVSNTYTSIFLRQLSVDALSWIFLSYYPLLAWFLLRRYELISFSYLKSSPFLWLNPWFVHTFGSHKVSEISNIFSDKESFGYQLIESFVIINKIFWLIVFRENEWWVLLGRIKNLEIYLNFMIFFKKIMKMN